MHVFLCDTLVLKCVLSSLPDVIWDPGYVDSLKLVAVDPRRGVVGDLGSLCLPHLGGGCRKNTSDFFHEIASIRWVFICVEVAKHRN